MRVGLRVRVSEDWVVREEGIMVARSLFNTTLIKLLSTKSFVVCVVCQCTLTLSLTLTLTLTLTLNLTLTMTLTVTLTLTPSLAKANPN